MTALWRVLAALHGATHEQRRYVADGLAGISLRQARYSLLVHDRPQRRITIAVAEQDGTTSQMAIHYAPERAPQEV